MSAWNGSMDYALSNEAISRETDNNHDLPYAQQLFMNEGGLKHFTGITSSQYLATLSAEYNLTNRFRLYAEGGTNGTDLAYGAGLRIPLLQNIVNIYLPVYTKNGMADFKNYQDIFRFNINFDFKLSLF